MPGHLPPLVRGQPHIARFRYEIADREYQPVLADDDAAADALRTQDARGERILGDH